MARRHGKSCSSTTIRPITPGRCCANCRAGIPACAASAASAAAACPAHADVLLDLERRTEDLLPIVRSHYYDREQRGRWSIKAVLPTLAPELDYAGLEVKDGTNAQDAYLEAIAADCPPERRRAIETALLTYCGRDTWAMVEVLRRMLAPA